MGSLNALKRLASQTAIYGVSSIIGRFLNYLLVPLYTYYFSPAEYGVVSEFYAYAGFLAVLLIFGFETGYFRFRDQNETAKTDLAYSTALWFLLIANLGFFFVILLLDQTIANTLQHHEHPEYIWWFALILALDSIGAIAFAKLRAENKAIRFAGIKLFEILVAIALNLFFIVLCQRAYTNAPDSFFAQFWDPAIGVGYIFIANLIASGVKWILVVPQLRGITNGFDAALFRKMVRYSLPMVIIGFAGVVNEMLDRALLKYLLPYDAKTNLQMLGIYSACYKLSILMTLFIQAFRYAGEPFFFSYAGKKDAQQTYADVLKYFVIFCVFIFLLVTLYIDIFKYFIGEPFRVGLAVVPILLLANLCLGVYVNLSIWYKLTDRTLMGAYVSVAGAVVTVVLNVWWIPIFGYIGAAWATLACYGGMMTASYLLGRRFYPVPYDIKRILGYVALGIAVYGANTLVLRWTGVNSILSGTALLGLFCVLVFILDVWPMLRPGREAAQGAGRV
jgi:O-antigen/teichoic acid export membrane protein